MQKYKQLKSLEPRACTVCSSRLSRYPSVLVRKELSDELLHA